MSQQGVKRRESLAVSIATQFAGKQAVITIPVAFIRLTGDYQAAAMLSQILYWWDANGKKKFPMSDTEMENTMLLTRNQLSRARGILRRCGVLMTYEGLPKRTHYDIDEVALGKCLLELAESATNEHPQQDAENSATDDGQQQDAENSAASEREIQQPVAENSATSVTENPQLYKDNSLSNDKELKEEKKEVVVEEGQRTEISEATTTTEKSFEEKLSSWFKGSAKRLSSSALRLELTKYLHERSDRTAWFVLSEAEIALAISSAKADTSSASFYTKVKFQLDQRAKLNSSQPKDFPRAAPLSGAEAEAAWQAWLKFRHKTPDEIFSSPRWKEFRDEEIPLELKDYASEQCRLFYRHRNQKTNDREREAEQEALQRKQQMLKDWEAHDSS